MKTNKIYKRSFIMTMALAVLPSPRRGPAPRQAAGPTECGLIGTWYGNSDSAVSWLGVHTAGTTIINGEMRMTWVRVRDYLLNPNLDPELGIQLEIATRLTDGHGVWEQTTRGGYKYTWYAYGIGSANDKPVYSVRVSGTAMNVDCDNIHINFTYEIFNGFVLPQEMSGVVPVATLTDVAGETRVPLTVVTP